MRCPGESDGVKRQRQQMSHEGVVLKPRPSQVVECVVSRGPPPKWKHGYEEGAVKTDMDAMEMVARKCPDNAPPFSAPPEKFQN